MAVDSLVGRIAGVSYLHIPARDVAASAGFYRDVFGWQLHGRPDGPSFSDGTGHVIGRWVTDQAVAGADGLRAYVYVADVDGHARRRHLPWRAGRHAALPGRHAPGCALRRPRRQRPRNLAGNLEQPGTAVSGHWPQPWAGRPPGKGKPRIDGSRRSHAVTSA